MTEPTHERIDQLGGRTIIGLTPDELSTILDALTVFHERLTDLADTADPTETGTWWAHREQAQALYARLNGQDQTR